MKKAILILLSATLLVLITACPGANDPGSGGTSIEFPADLLITSFFVGLNAAAELDVDPDPDTFQATVTGTNGGFSVYTLYTDPISNDTLETLVFTNHNDTGTAYTGTLTGVFDAAGAGTTTGAVDGTGVYNGHIITNITNPNDGGDPTGTWDVDGTIYTHAELLAYLAM